VVSKNPNSILTYLLEKRTILYFSILFECNLFYCWYWHGNFQKHKIAWNLWDIGNSKHVEFFFS